MTRYNHDWFLKRIQERRPKDYRDYRFLEPYTSSREKIKAVHIPCGREIEIIPNSFISRGSGCRFCSREKAAKKQMKSHEEYVKSLPKHIKTLSEYRGAHKKIKVHCSKCDNTYSIIARELAENGCSRCSGRFKRTLEDVINEVSKVTQGDYVVKSTSYKNAHTKIKLQHLECGTVYEVTMANFRKGRRCPYCRASVGETLVETFLKKYNITYERHKKFPDLKYIGYLSYDFYLPKYNILIEYQGEQHYMPVEHFGGLEQFIIQVEIDNIKYKYAQDNKYRLIEIPYVVDTYEDVETFLKTRLI